ncbi:MAG: hypothetical protein U1E53_20360 [Dongiaceae bacterium]
MARSSSVLLLTAAAWFLVSLAVYGANGRTLYSGDAVATALIPITLVLDGTVTLDRFADEERQPGHYWVVETPRGLASLFPIGAAIVATPILAGPILWQAWTHPSLSPAEWRTLALEHWQKWAAAILAALAVAVFWRTALALGAGLPLAAALTAQFAFGSQMMAIGSQSLWQHGPGALMILAGVACLARPGSPGRAGAVLLGLALGLAVIVRPTNLVFAAPLFLVALRRQPSRAPLVLLAALIVAVPIAWYNWWAFGNLLGGYGRGTPNFRPDLFLAHLPGVLVSPARGLLIYFPATLLLAALLAVRPAVLRRDLALALVVGIVLLLFINTCWRFWWGGWSYGPRFMTELQGPILLLIVMAWPTLRPGRIAAGAALGLAMLVSVPIQVAGVYSETAAAWDARPDIQRNLGRLWDVGDSPYLRALKANLGQP